MKAWRGAESWLDPPPEGQFPWTQFSAAQQAHHDPGVVHKLRDGHSLSGLCFQQVPDKHLHYGGGAGRQSSGAMLSPLLLPQVFREKPDVGAGGGCREAESPRS